MNSKKNVFTPFLRTNFFLYITFLLFPISERMATLSLLLALLYGLFLTINKKKTVIKKNIPLSFLLPLFFFIIVIINALVFGGYSNIEAISKYAFFFISYLVLLSLNKPLIRFNNPLDWFVVGLIILLIISFIRFLSYGVFPILYADVEKYTHIHPVYLSAYLLVAINHLLFSNKWRPIIKVFLILIFCAILVLAQSRIAYLALLVLSIFYLISNNVVQKKYLFVVAIVIIGFLVSLKYTSKTPIEAAINERMQTWESSISVITENVWFGVGFSNEFTELGKQYFYEAKFNLLDRKLNSHNMYLSILIQSGIVGLIFFIALFLYPIFNIRKDLKPEYFGFIIVIGIICLTESIFVRNWSMVLVLMLNYYSIFYEEVQD